MCSISGGADSDVMMDLIYRVDVNHKVDYVWFDTGIEYQATKDHLEYLEERYCVDIKREKAIKPIPLSCKEYGQPFLNKHVSEMLSRMQRHDFDFKNDGDKDYDYLMNKYQRMKSALDWWCNKNGSMFCINLKKGLKEFILQNPPWFKISNKCCSYAKKDVAKKIIKNNGYGLNIYGIRKEEGGIRKVKYKNCFSESDGCDNYRPLFWYNTEDRVEYEKNYHIIHSDCYTKYGMIRTGCAGCPFECNVLYDKLENLKQNELKLYVACNNIFKDSYEYTKMYLKFRDDIK